MRILVWGKRAEISAGRHCDPTKLNNYSGCAIGTKEEIMAINNFLYCLQTKLRNVHHVFIDGKHQVTTEIFQNPFTSKTQKNRLMMELFKAHNTKKSIGRKVST